MSNRSYGTANNLSLLEKGNISQPRKSDHSCNRFNIFLWCYNFSFPPGYSKFPGVKIIFLVLLLHRIHFYSTFNFINLLSSVRGPSNPPNEYSGSTAQAFLSASTFLAPLPGLIADKYFPRVRVISFCLLLSLLGSSVQSFFHSFYELNGFPIPNSAYYLVHIISFIILALGSSGMFALLLPVGIDQMEGAGESRLKSYFNWHYWVGNFGYLFAIGRFFIYEPDIDSRLGLLASSYLATVAIFLAVVVFKLSLTFNLLQWNKPGGTPLKQITGVIHSAFETKHRRKKDTKYTDLKLFDYASIENGGKFEYEEVQDVKTFLKILCVIGCMSWYFGVYNLLNTEFPKQGRKISCAENTFYASIIISSGDCLAIAIILPLFELIRSKFKRLGFTKILYKFQLGIIFGLLAIASALIVDVSFNQAGFTCRRVRDNEEAGKILRFLPILLPQTIFIGLSECFAWIGAMEFVYAQSPHYMKGFTFGILQSITGAGWYLPNVISFFLYLGSSCSHSCSTCLVHSIHCFEKETKDYVFYIIFFVLTSLYVTAFGALAFLYKRRERQKIENWPNI